MKIRKIRKVLFSTFLRSLEGIFFENKNLLNLSIDTSKISSSREVKGAIFSLCLPSQIKSPKLVAISKPALELLGLKFDSSDHNNSQNNNSNNSNNSNNNNKKKKEYLDKDNINLISNNLKFINYFCGNEIIPGSQPAAHCYCGYQFGYFAGQLGDGAAIYLGEIINKETGQKWELQLKGAGPTPYSRMSDGRKVLRSSIREFLASEAMYNLGIPTTRAGTCITSETLVPRDLFYNGTIVYEKCTVISRIASNFFRFGSFEIFHKGNKNINQKSGPSEGRLDLKKQLYDHILTYYPEIHLLQSSNEEKYRLLFEEIFNRTIKLLTLWEGVGFVHGVLNTDNMSIMGLTIDYGPFAFLEGYDPDFTPNGSDQLSRYTVKKQKNIIKWNLERLAEALFPLVSKEDSLLILSTFDSKYKEERLKQMKNKFGFRKDLEGDEKLVNEFFDIMAECWSDFNDSFYALNLFIQDLTAHQNNDDNNDQKLEIIQNKCFERIVFRSMTPIAIVNAQSRKLSILRQSHVNEEKIQELLNLIKDNPQQAIILFNGADLKSIKEELLKELENIQLITRIQESIRLFENMDENLKKTNDEKKWKNWLHKYQDRMKYEINFESNERIESMRLSNPAFILRNWIAFKVIEAAESGDYSKVQLVLEMLQDPYNPNFSLFSETPNELYKEYIRPSPDWAPSYTCTCSS